MLIYKKYIAKAIFYPFIALSFILTSLVWITQILKLLPLLDKGISSIDFLKLIILILPSLFFMISPLISVISVIYVYNKLQEDRQLIILKTSGLTNFAIAKPALIVATFITFVSYYVSLYLTPLSYSKLKCELSNFRENYVSNIITEKTFNQLSKYITIYVEKKNANGSLNGIVLFDNKIPENHSVLFAKTGKVIMRGTVPLFQLQDGFRQSFDDNNNITKLHFDDLLIEIQKNDSAKEDRNKTSLELYIHQMLWPDNTLSEERKTRLIIDAHQRLVWPLFNYGLVFLALSMFLTITPNRGTNIKQIIYTFFPLLIVAYFHFSLQKIAYQEPLYIFACYLNIFLCIVFSIWKTNKTTI